MATHTFFFFVLMWKIYLFSTCPKVPLSYLKTNPSFPLKAVFFPKKSCFFSPKKLCWLLGPSKLFLDESSGAKSRQAFVFSPFFQHVHRTSTPWWFHWKWQQSCLEHSKLSSEHCGTWGTLQWKIKFTLKLKNLSWEAKTKGGVACWILWL